MEDPPPPAVRRILTSTGTLMAQPGNNKHNLQGWKKEAGLYVAHVPVWVLGTGYSALPRQNKELGEPSPQHKHTYRRTYICTYIHTDGQTYIILIQTRILNFSRR